jgi:hypothetical protein
MHTHFANGESEHGNESKEAKLLKRKLSLHPRFYTDISMQKISIV